MKAKIAVCGSLTVLAILWALSPWLDPQPPRQLDLLSEEEDTVRLKHLSSKTWDTGETLRREDPAVHVCLRDRNTLKPISGALIRARLTPSGQSELLQSDKRGIVRVPSLGVWSFSYAGPTHKKSFNSESVKISSTSKQILVGGVGSVRLHLQGARNVEGFAALLDASKMEGLLGKRASILKNAKALRRTLTATVPKALIRDLGTSSKMLEWADIPTGREYVILVSHSLLLHVSPAHRFWYGEWISSTRLRMGSAFKQPCPITRKFSVTPGNAHDASARFACRQSLSISFQGFNQCEIVSLALRKHLHAGKQKVLNTWQSVKAWQQRPGQSPVTITELPAGDYRLHALGRKPDGSLLCSFIEVTLESGAIHYVSLADGSGEERLWLTVSHPKADARWIKISAKPSRRKFGRGLFVAVLESPLPRGVIEIVGLPGATGYVSIDKRRINFDLGKKRRY